MVSRYYMTIKMNYTIISTQIFAEGSMNYIVLMFLNQLDLNASLLCWNLTSLVSKKKYSINNRCTMEIQIGICLVGSAKQKKFRKLTPIMRQACDDKE